jgi:hypothetical protein
MCIADIRRCRVGATGVTEGYTLAQRAPDPPQSNEEKRHTPADFLKTRVHESGKNKLRAHDAGERGRKDGYMPAQIISGHGITSA